KYYLFYIVLGGQCLVFAFSGGLWNIALGTQTFAGWQDKQGQLRGSTGFVLALCLLLFSGCILLPLTKAGFFGSQLVIGPFNTVVSLVVVGTVFGFLYVFAQNWLTLRHVEQATKAESATAPDAVRRESLQKRRSFIQQGLTVLGLGALGFIAWRFITGTESVAHTPQAALNNYKSKISPPPKSNYCDS